MKSARKQWANPIGRWTSLVLVAVGVALASLCALTAAGVINWGEQRDSAAVRGSVAAVNGGLALLLIGFAIRPTWSVTVGNRGIGIKRLWRQTFVDYASFESIQLDESGKLRIVTGRGAIRIFPQIADAAGLVAHVNTIASRDR